MKAYDLEFNGRHKDGTYRHLQAEVIEAETLDDAKRELIKDYVTIDIYYVGITTMKRYNNAITTP